MKISVITPTYNRVDMLRDAVDSFLSQDYKDKELIIVNDGGMKPPDYNNNQIKVYNIEHKNQANAQNFGLSNCTGDYCCTLDDDDYFYDMKSLSKRAEELDKGYEIVWGDYVDINWRSEKIRALSDKDNTQIWQRDRIGINTMMWRHNIVDKIGGYWFLDTLTSNEDWHFKIRALSLCKCNYINYDIMYHRIHAGMRSDEHRRSGELGNNQILLFNDLEELKKQLTTEKKIDIL
jgi:glycosyltransferase involved in cell wall biosynthesis